MVPTFLDVETGKTTQGPDNNLFWYEGGNGACDCNRCLYFEDDALEAEMDRRVGNEPDDSIRTCYGHARFYAVDVEGDLEGRTKEEVLALMNEAYPARA